MTLAIKPVWPTKNGFRHWLESCGTKSVGVCGSVERCAIARYVLHLNPSARKVIVDESRVQIVFDHDVFGRDFSKWQSDFIDLFDFGPDGEWRVGWMSGKKALELLR